MFCDLSARSLGFLRQKSIHVKYLRNVWDTFWDTKRSGLWQEGPSAPSFSCGAEASLSVSFWGACALGFEGGRLIHACASDPWGDDTVNTCWWKRQKDVAEAVPLKSVLPFSVSDLYWVTVYILWVGKQGWSCFLCHERPSEGGNLHESSPRRQCLASSRCDANVWVEPAVSHVHPGIINV